MSNKSPTIIIKGVDEVGKQIKNTLSSSRNELKTKVGKVVDVVYRTARAKRPMVTLFSMMGETHNIPGKVPKELIKGGVAKKVRRVSNPDAKFGVPVRTGALQRSIQKETHFSGPWQATGRVWTDLYYASYLEDGTSKMAARPFMRPALDMNKQLIDKIMGGHGYYTDEPNAGSPSADSGPGEGSGFDDSEQPNNDVGDAVA